MALAPKAPEERRRRILTATVDVLRERGFAGTRVADIADAAGTSSGPGALPLQVARGRALGGADHGRGRLLRRARGASSVPSAGPVERLRRMAEMGAGSGPAVGDWALWLEIWVRALRDPGARATREQLDRRWRGCAARGRRRGGGGRGLPRRPTPRTRPSGWPRSWTGWRSSWRWTTRT